MSLLARPLATTRTLGDKLHELADLSPADIRAIETTVDRRLREVKVERIRVIQRARRPWLVDRKIL